MTGRDSCHPDAAYRRIRMNVGRGMPPRSGIRTAGYAAQPVGDVAFCLHRRDACEAGAIAGVRRSARDTEVESLSGLIGVDRVRLPPADDRVEPSGHVSAYAPAAPEWQFVHRRPDEPMRKIAAEHAAIQAPIKFILVTGILSRIEERCRQHVDVADVLRKRVAEC